jgi:glycosyltransferase involved in cell wall biosynthesis
MHVVVLPSNYANPYNPDKTPFYRDHARLTADRGHQTGLVALVAVSLRKALRQRLWAYGLHQGRDAGITTWVYPYPAPLRSRRLDRAVRRHLTKRVATAYTRAHGVHDLLHAHGAPGAECARWWHQQTGAPFLVTMHSTELYGEGADEAAQKLAPVLADAAALVAVSPGYADHLTRLTQRPFRFLPNPVDTDFFRPPASPRPEGTPFVFASVADLNRRKNHALLIDAFAAWFGGDMGYRLVIGGSGPERPTLERQVDALGLKGQVTFAGQLDRRGVRDLLQASDAFVLPSQLETFGVVLVEALACGIPVVATRSHGPEAIIRGPSLGALADHEPNALGTAMARVAHGRFDPKVLRAEAVSRYGLATVSDQLESLYQEVLGA